MRVLQITLTQLNGTTERPVSLIVGDSYVIESGGNPAIRIKLVGKGKITVELLAPMLALDDDLMRWAATQGLKEIRLSDILKVEARS